MGLSIDRFGHFKVVAQINLTGYRIGQNFVTVAMGQDFTQMDDI